MSKVKLPPILKLLWTYLESEKVEVHHIIVYQQEFYTISCAGNLLFTPEEINAHSCGSTTIPISKRPGLCGYFRSQISKV